ncbi:MAG: sigma-54 dependent transcriptional regulator [Planctomycetota bacterium]
MDFYPSAHGALKKENARLLRELKKSKASLKDALSRLEILQRKLGGKLKIILEEATAKQREFHPESGSEFKYDYSGIVGESEKVKNILRTLDHVIESSVPVLIQGESGTGKELVARAIHFNGPRRLKKFVAENCAAIPETLLESELFGYEEGAFTGAIHHGKKGLFELADGGTLILDEISNMSQEMQKKLLRVLQDNVIRKVGGNTAIKVDIRIISISNKNLRELVDKGRFRNDLFYRINAITINLPPLRERKEDIPVLIGHFFKKISRDTATPPREVDPEVIQLFMNYDWPGNVRELENEIYRLIAFSEDIITPDLVSSHIQGTAQSAMAKTPGLLKYEKLDQNTLRKAVANVEREILAKALEKTGGNRTKAARMLGLSTAGLIKKMDRCGLSIVLRIRQSNKENPTS